VLRTAAGEPLSTDDIAGLVIATKDFNSGDAILRAAVRQQVGSTVKGCIAMAQSRTSARGRASKWMRRRRDAGTARVASAQVALLISAIRTFS
jgi:hypothetical protein